MDFNIKKIPNRIYLHLSNLTDEELIRGLLSDQFEFVNTYAGIDAVEFDLCILSVRKFRSYKEKLIILKERTGPVYLPVILLVKKEYLKAFLNSEVSKIYDDVLPIPISPEILNSRIQSLIKQRRVSLELQEKNTLANKAINATDIGISISDASVEDNPLIFINEGFEKLTGYEKSEAIGKNCRFLQNNDNNQESLAELRKAIDRREATKVLLRNYKKNGEMFWNKLSVSPIKGINEQEQYYVGIQTDVTELINYQNELKELVEEKESLIREIQYRIRNNLAVILGVLESKIIELRSVSSLKEVRDRLSSLSKVHQLLFEQEKLHEIRFHEYIQNLLVYLKKSFSPSEKNVKLELDSAPMRMNFAQAVTCGMLISELIMDVFKDGSENGSERKVNVLIREKNEHVEIKVRDNRKNLPKVEKLEESVSVAQSMVTTFLQQLDAQWEYSMDQGFEFTFEFDRQDGLGLLK